MKQAYEQSYRTEWEQNPLFSTWLCKAQDGCSAHCKAIHVRILSRMASLKEHNACAKHKKNMIGFTGSSKIDKLFKNSSVSDGMKKAEIKIVSVLVEHNVPFLVMDHLSDVIKDTFPDSEIARKFSCKRTKSSAIAYNVLGGQFEEKMIQDLKSGLSTFSVIIDVSTVSIKVTKFKIFFL
ncbi:hypothetical protein JTB14_018234 [Gonioctena quinquepunctata]|nr:hypothetical protein JTB14_018234 [Gonioctena quinquepunctata]